MNKPSSTAQAAGVYPFIAATILTTINIFWPEVYVKIPSGYEGHLIAFIAFLGAWKQKENVYHMVPK